MSGLVGYLNITLLQIYHWVCHRVVHGSVLCDLIQPNPTHGQLWSVKKFRKSVNIWESYRQEFNVLFFWLTVLLCWSQSIYPLSLLSFGGICDIRVRILSNVIQYWLHKSTRILVTLRSQDPYFWSRCTDPCFLMQNTQNLAFTTLQIRLGITPHRRINYSSLCSTTYVHW